MQRALGNITHKHLKFHAHTSCQYTAMRAILKLARIQIAIIVLFVLLKFVRPSVLEGNFPEWTKTMLLSLPNFFEGIIGVLMLTGIGLYLNHKLLGLKKQIKANLIYTFALIAAAIYVISQEYKVHNLGGNNVYDQNDVLFSVVGLGIGYVIVRITKPVVTRAMES